MSYSEEQQINDDVLESMRREVEAQLGIAKALEPVRADRRAAVLEAVAHILEAEKRVPGIFDMIARGGKKRHASATGRANEGSDRSTATQKGS